MSTGTAASMMPAMPTKIKLKLLPRQNSIGMLRRTASLSAGPSRHRGLSGILRRGRFSEGLAGPRCSAPPGDPSRGSGMVSDGTSFAAFGLCTAACSRPGIRGQPHSGLARAGFAGRRSVTRPSPRQASRTSPSFASPVTGLRLSSRPCSSAGSLKPRFPRPQSSSANWPSTPGHRIGAQGCSASQGTDRFASEEAARFAPAMRSQLEAEV